MSNIYDLIIKNGNCFINNNLAQTDIGIKDNRIIKIGLINESADKVLDAQIKFLMRRVLQLFQVR